MSENADQPFDPPHALAWLGIPYSTYMKAASIAPSRHSNPLQAALRTAHDVWGSATTPAEILARYGIDPKDMLAAVRAHDPSRTAYRPQ